MVVLGLQAACGMCANEDEVRVASPDRQHVAYSYLRNCGATTDYVTMVDLETRHNSCGANVYSAEGAYDVTLSWPSSNELHIECRGCPPRHPTAPPIDGVTITVISAARGSVVVPRLSSDQGGSAAPTRDDVHDECPSFADLWKQVDAKVAAITALEAGLPLEDFTARFASPALNFWDNVGTDRETVFSVT